MLESDGQAARLVRKSSIQHAHSKDFTQNRLGPFADLSVQHASWLAYPPISPARIDRPLANDYICQKQHISQTVVLYSLDYTTTTTKDSVKTEL